MNSEAENFDVEESDLTPKEKPFQYGKQTLVLKECSEPVHVQYRNAMFRSVRVSGDMSSAQMDGIASADLVLLKGCLFIRTQDGIGGHVDCQVDDKFINSLLHRICKPWVEWVKLNSGMIDEDETVESLEKEIATLQKRLDKKKGTVPGKVLVNSTPTTSG